MTDGNATLAAMLEAQARIADLQNAAERLREERDAARSSVDLLMHECATLEERLREATATIDRLRLHLQQGVEI
jgi:hypothetical protein